MILIKAAQDVYNQTEALTQSRLALAQSEQEREQILFDEKIRKEQILANLRSQLLQDAIDDYQLRIQADNEYSMTAKEIAINDQIQQEKILEQKRIDRIAAAKLALGDTQAFLDLEAKINQDFENAKINAKEASTKKIIALSKEERDTTIKFASEAFTGVLGFIAATQGQSEADARKAFNLNKAAGIADATVNTFLGASQALRDPKLPTLAKAFAVAGIIASGLTQVRKIAATQFQGGGGGSSVPSPAPGGASMTPPPTFTNPQTTMLGNQGESIPSQGQQNQPMRAYVVERDIQQTTSRVRRLSEFATLG